MTPEAALAGICAHADDEKAQQARAYHKADRTYLGVPNPVLNHLTRGWRKAFDGPARDLNRSWPPDFDSWTVADHACMAGQRRLLQDPARVDQVAPWTRSDHIWTRRAALVITLPWTKQDYPGPQDLAIRDRVLGWAASYIPDRDWFIQKAIAWWLRELSQHDRPRVEAFLAQHGTGFKPFARREAAKHL